MKKIVISGASGFVGSALKNYFLNNNCEVTIINRIDFSNEETLSSKINNCDVLINLNGANIINRWSESYKKLLYSSRIDTTKSLVNTMKQVSDKPNLFISTSAVGIYKNDKVYGETSEEFGDDFLANLVVDWEKEALRANELGIRTTIFRFGIVLGRDGGALAKMITPFKFGLGGTIGDGTQAFSFIHLDDLLSAYSFVIENDTLDGVFNLTAPNPTTNYGLTKALGKSLSRPTILPVPEFVLNLIFSEGAKVLTDGQSVVPQKLLDSGFEFQYKNIEDTIESLV
jgi:uncharacterized protein (TIGR01777 family)